MRPAIRTILPLAILILAEIPAFPVDLAPAADAAVVGLLRAPQVVSVTNAHPIWYPVAGGLRYNTNFWVNWTRSPDDSGQLTYRVCVLPERGGSPAGACILNQTPEYVIPNRANPRQWVGRRFWTSGVNPALFGYNWTANVTAQNPTLPVGACDGAASPCAIGTASCYTPPIRGDVTGVHTQCGSFAWSAPVILSANVTIPYGSASAPSPAILARVGHSADDPNASSVGDFRYAIRYQLANPGNNTVIKACKGLAGYYILTSALLASIAIPLGIGFAVGSLALPKEICRYSSTGIPGSTINALTETLPGTGVNGTRTLNLSILGSVGQFAAIDAIAIDDRTQLVGAESCQSILDVRDIERQTGCGFFIRQGLNPVSPPTGPAPDISPSPRFPLINVTQQATRLGLVPSDLALLIALFLIGILTIGGFVLAGTPGAIGLGAGAFILTASLGLVQIWVVFLAAFILAFIVARHLASGRGGEP